MDGLNRFLEELKEKKSEIENRDIESIVTERMCKIEEQIRDEELARRDADLKVVEIKIETIEEAVSIIEEDERENPEEKTDTLPETISPTFIGTP